MKKAGKKLFQALGELRDMQVMEEWIEKLGVLGDSAAGDAPTLAQRTRKDGAPGVSTGIDDDPVAVKLLDHVHAREARMQAARVQRSRISLTASNGGSGRELCRGARSRVRPGSVVYLHLALEKWTAAYDLHKHALRMRSQVSWHELRIGIKRFRYTVENFLPRQHALWGDDLKELQDLLGEVHDLDVLWATAVEIAAFPDVESREPLAGEVECGTQQEDCALSREDGGTRVAVARVAGGVAVGAATCGRRREPSSHLGGISGS